MSGRIIRITFNGISCIELLNRTCVVERNYFPDIKCGIQSGLSLRAGVNFQIKAMDI